jgi:hypothetical protein
MSLEEGLSFCGNLAREGLGPLAFDCDHFLRNRTFQAVEGVRDWRAALKFGDVVPVLAAADVPLALHRQAGVVPLRPAPPWMGLPARFSITVMSAACRRRFARIRLVLTAMPRCTIPSRMIVTSALTRTFCRGRRR